MHVRDRTWTYATPGVTPITATFLPTMIITPTPTPTNKNIINNRSITVTIRNHQARATPATPEHQARARSKALQKWKVNTPGRGPAVSQKNRVIFRSKEEEEQEMA
jgi:hypothetical protein